MEALQRIKARLKTEKKVWIPVCIGILAIFLLALSEFLPQGQTENTENTVSTESEDAYCEALESRLAAVISEVENADACAFCSHWKAHPKPFTQPT